MKIKHNEFVNFYNKDNKIFDRIFKDTKLLSTLVSKIKKESKNWEKFGYCEKTKCIIDPIKCVNKMTGHLFEIFCELFFKIEGPNPVVGVYNYNPAQEDDCGVDATGIGMNGMPLTVQCKFRSNTETELMECDLHQFAYQSQNRFNVGIDDINNMIVFTSAKGLHCFTEGNVFLNKVRTIGFKEIKNIVDNNPCFWLPLNDYIKKTIKKSY